ncbi:hypothetical protein ACIQW7_24475 [Peribacillus simplex]|uniref:hypothetical protein n=1 Tax=Peribacillus simplex TaxID=1478 RepID=UPI0037FF7ED7
MDRLEDISLSRIATILDKKTIIKTNNNSKWERVLSNAGQSELYDRFRNSLNPYSYNGQWQNDNSGFEEFYSAIKSILIRVYSNGENAAEFNLLISTIVDEINIMDIFEDEIQEFIQKKSRYYNDTLDELFKDKTDKECLEFMQENAINDYRLLINNLNILNLDITYSNRKLKLTPFTQQFSKISRNPSLLVDWLNDNYSAIGKMYKEAIENYIDGEAVSCISNCRNILTGIFSYFKDDGNKSWTKGLQNLSTDINIENIQAPNNIAQNSANKGILFENDKVFKYPRFKLIYHLYSLTSDLGSHSTEAPKIGGELFPEDTTLNDALLCLRMTEDVLIWVKERLKSYQ